MLFLKCLPPNLRAHQGFQWPSQVGNIVESETWDPAPVCGGGLHGLINGNGNSNLLPANYLDNCIDLIWIAFESVNKHGNPSDAETVAIDDEDGQKGKCHRAIIRAIGSKKTATDWLMAQGCTGVHYAVDAAHGRKYATVGDHGVALVGHKAHAIAGEEGIAVAGHSGTAFATDSGVALAGDNGSADAHDAGIAVAGYYGKATTWADGIAITGTYGRASTGDHGTAKTEYDGVAMAGCFGTAIAGPRGTAGVGRNGTAIAGAYGSVIGGPGSVLIINSPFGPNLHENVKKIVAVVGQNGIKPDTRYRLSDSDEFVEVETEDNLSLL